MSTFSQSSKKIAPVITFGGIVVLIYALFILLIQNNINLLSHDALVIGITFDLMLTVPVLFYFLVIRPYKLSLLTIAPVLLLSYLGASWILPAQHQWAVRTAEWFILPLELGLIGFISVRVLRTVRAIKSGEGEDLLTSAYFESSKLISQPKLAAMFSTELAIFIYGLFSFGQQPHAPAQSKVFYYHRNNALSAIIFQFFPFPSLRDTDESGVWYSEESP